MRFPDPLRRTLWIWQSIVWLAGWIVPRQQRPEWRQQRNRQVWYWAYFLVESGHFARGKRLELAKYYWRLFGDAFWRRYDREPFLRRADRMRRSPATCLLTIFSLVVGLVLVGGCIPAALSFSSSAVSQPERACLVSLNGKFRRFRSETLFDFASAWTGSRLLESVAPYSWGPARLFATKRTVPIWSARVAPTFFDVLGVKAALGRTFHSGDAQPCGNCAVLNHETWRVQFRGDPAVVGRVIVVDGDEKAVIGVLPANFHLASPDIAVWTLLDSASLSFTNFVERVGAVARMKDGATEGKVETDLADLSENAGYVFPASILKVTSIQTEVRRTVEMYLAIVLFSVMCAASIVYVRRPGGNLPRVPTSFGERCRWWGFFVAKSVLLLIASGLLAWAGVHWIAIYLVGSLYPMADLVAWWLFLVLSVAPLSWSIQDQQSRCRVCLRRLGIPIMIGIPGYVLLNWSGTEMVCSAGHGSLYLPDSEANWLERDRWNSFDESWADLFRGELENGPPQGE